MLAVAFALAVGGCRPQIGDQCVLNTDCSVDGTRQCDTSLPGGYCTMFNCGPNSCPDQSACYLFNAEVQGCPYSDRSPSRTAHSFCMKDCHQNSDCRGGYVCQDLRKAPWNAVLLDDNQNQAVCVPDPDKAFNAAGYETAAVEAGTEVPVCQADPSLDASFGAAPDAGIAAADAAADASDAGVDASSGTGDAGLDATLDGGLDGGLDATLNDAGADASDAGAPDATLD